MDDTVAIDVAGETLLLHADRAAWWPARHSLFIADLHLGKGDSLRAAGIPVPTGGSEHDLNRLTAFIRRTNIQRLWILGDFLHGSRKDGSWREQWLAFRAMHAELDIRLVLGNHDRAMPGLGLDIPCFSGSVAEGPFVLVHAPAEGEADGPMRICGHLHPVTRAPGLPGRHPAFVLEAGQIILPAFSAFTGGSLTDERSERIACIAGHLLRIPGR